MTIELWILFVTLACLAGVFAMVIAWPRRQSQRRRPVWPTVLLVLCLGGPVVAATAMFYDPYILDEERLPWIPPAFTASCAVTLALALLWFIGDRPHGRRRCPRCWYDMSGAPAANLVCPECGSDAGLDRRLLRSRRPTRILAAALLPVVMVSLMWAGAIFGSPDWARRLPNTALVLAAPFAPPDSAVGAEVADSSQQYNDRRFSRWQRWAIVRGVRLRLRFLDSPEEMFHVSDVLVGCDAPDALPIPALLALTRHADVNTRNYAIFVIGNATSDLTAVKARLLELVASSDASDAHVALSVLADVLERLPGGTPPERVLATVRDGSLDTLYRVRAIAALALMERDERSRAALHSVSGNARPHARVAYFSLWPDEPGSPALLIGALRDAREREVLLRGLARADMRLRAATGSLPPYRLALYSPHVCDELEGHLQEAKANNTFLADADAWNVDFFEWIESNSAIAALLASIAEARRAHAAQSPVPSR